MPPLRGRSAPSRRLLALITLACLGLIASRGVATAQAVATPLVPGGVVPEAPPFEPEAGEGAEAAPDDGAPPPAHALDAAPATLPGWAPAVYYGVPLSRLSEARLAAVLAILRREYRQGELSGRFLLPDGTYGTMPREMARDYMLGVYVHQPGFQAKLGEIHGAAFPIALSAADHARLRDALDGDPAGLSPAPWGRSGTLRSVAASDLDDAEFARVVQLLRDVAEQTERIRLSDPKPGATAGTPDREDIELGMTQWMGRRGFRDELKKIGLQITDLGSPSARAVLEGALQAALRTRAAPSGVTSALTWDRRAIIEDHLREWDDYLRATPSPALGRLMAREERRAAISAYIRAGGTGGFAEFLLRRLGPGWGALSRADLAALDGAIVNLTARPASAPIYVPTAFAAATGACGHDHGRPGLCLVGLALCQAPEHPERCCRYCRPKP
ncbi:hypothetical protein [Paludisphaera sp.]|uniref:hypothetical protein n=1 Tax=Paludisphaera sp. TaxID=2017432 RepID=UPI00301D1CAB